MQFKHDGAETKNIRIQERLARLTLTSLEGPGLVIKIFLVENSRAVRRFVQKDIKNAPQCPMPRSRAGLESRIWTKPSFRILVASPLQDPNLGRFLKTPSSTRKLSCDPLHLIEQPSLLRVLINHQHGGSQEAAAHSPNSTRHLP